LYNHANYLIRKELISNGKWLRYEELDKILKSDTEFSDYKDMRCAVASQQTLRSIDAVWKAYFQAHKDYVKHPDK
jgi:putative transposase